MYAHVGKEMNQMRVLKSDDGKKIVIDVNKDPCIYEDSRYNATRGLDLHAHKAESGKIFFYFYRWSQWENENTDVELCTKEYAEEFLINRSGNITEDEIKVAKEYGIDLLEETA